MWRLIDEETKQPVTLPYPCKTFRGGSVLIVDARPPHKPSSTGFIYAESGAEWYPSVCNLKWVKD